VASYIAQLKKLSLAEVATSTTQNFKALFLNHIR
jgi:Tat protein secretion system quality control protein TatD with DNase activity